LRSTFKKHKSKSRNSSRLYNALDTSLTVSQKTQRHPSINIDLEQLDQEEAPEEILQ